MNLELRERLVQGIKRSGCFESVIEGLSMDGDGTGRVAYKVAAIQVDPSAPGFRGTETAITDEELVRAYLLTRLVENSGYRADSDILEMEKSYKPVGRPIGKGGRIDLIVKQPSGEAFFFIECKAPDKYDEELHLIDGQLFRLSRQEDPRPRYLIYYTVDLSEGELRERTIVIDTDTFSSFEAWDSAGQPIVDVIPRSYGRAAKRQYANVSAETSKYRTLNRDVSPETLNRIRAEIHDVIWGGGGTNNNEVFINIVRLILCKIYDEKETSPREVYRFQRRGDAKVPEEPRSLVGRMNELYREAENAYLALPHPSPGPAFDTSRISAEKLAYVIGRLEGLSLTENAHPGDLLGEFFEQIVEQDFTQTKGQFFTHTKLVRFMLHLVGSADEAKQVMIKHRDHLGRPRLPFVIDPACGSGTFLIEYMKLLQRGLGAPAIGNELPSRVREAHEAWFGGGNKNIWARDYLFGIENNYDLGLAAKVNMVLHGDGSMNTWIKSGLLPFREYWVGGRNNVLGVGAKKKTHPYRGELNEQFDLIISNPPFSLRLSPDEQSQIRNVFDAAPSSRSETLFVERWYQLLRPEGLFCCVLPEAVLDTSTYGSIREFLLQHFRVLAVVSLPYSTFQPFTSTKTCIVVARKRDEKSVAAVTAAWRRTATSRSKKADAGVAKEVFAELGWDEEQIFMAEPEYVGYKRRKNLPDLPRPNELYPEGENGSLGALDMEEPKTVLEYYRATRATASSKLGFWTTLGQVTSRDGLRLDPKYRWLWDFLKGIAFGDGDSDAVALGEIIGTVNLERASKGELNEEALLIDLADVESRQAFIRDDASIVETLGSDKWRLDGCELAISKLEPYLGKIIIDPPSDSLGSTEWVGLTRKDTSIPRLFLAYLLMLPEMCEAYRRLQSGKRHARFDKDEFLELKIVLPETDKIQEIHEILEKRRQEILDLREREREVRFRIDKSFR